jgi:hypothetical protein
VGLDSGTVLAFGAPIKLLEYSSTWYIILLLHGVWFFSSMTDVPLTRKNRIWILAATTKSFLDLNPLPSCFYCSSCKLIFVCWQSACWRRNILRRDESIRPQESECFLAILSIRLLYIRTKRGNPAIHNAFTDHFLRGMFDCTGRRRLFLSQLGSIILQDPTMLKANGYFTIYAK